MDRVIAVNAYFLISSQIKFITTVFEKNISVIVSALHTLLFYNIFNGRYANHSTNLSTYVTLIHNQLL